MLKKILLALIFVITAITNVTHAEDDMKTVASKAYVDTKIETKQLKIPAAGQPNVGAGETVMTYTSTGNGQIGERGLYSDISSYNATTDGDKLITASALNDTFTNLHTTDTTKLECANLNDGCTLWTIVDQTAYGNPSKNLYNKADGVIYGYPTASFTWLARTETRAELSIVVKLTEGETYTAQRVAGAGSVFRIQASATYPLTDGQSLQNIDSTGGNDVIQKTFTVPPGYPYVVFYVRNTGSASSLTVDDVINAFQVEKGTTATPYEPYY